MLTQNQKDIACFVESCLLNILGKPVFKSLLMILNSYWSTEQKLFRRPKYYILVVVGGLCYPGLATEHKAYLRRTTCQPTLLYASRYINRNNAMTNKLNLVQSTCIKNEWGLGIKAASSY